MKEFTIIDSYPNKSETIIRSENDLEKYLLSVLYTEINQIVILHSPNSGDLTLGIGRPYGFVEFMDEFQTPPYLIATDQIKRKETRYYEFDSGGTPTPISSDTCLEINQVINIARFFFSHGKIPDYVTWKES
jgi:hypothetical protein